MCAVSEPSLHILDVLSLQLYPRFVGKRHLTRSLYGSACMCVITIYSLHAAERSYPSNEAFNGFRTFALSRSWAVSILVTVLSFMPFVTGMVCVL